MVIEGVADVLVVRVRLHVAAVFITRLFVGLDCPVVVSALDTSYFRNDDEAEWQGEKKLRADWETEKSVCLPGNKVVMLHCAPFLAIKF